MPGQEKSMKKIGIIHTTPATIESLSRLVKELIRDTEVVNLLDDSILGDMRECHEVEYVRERWIGYAGNLERLGVDVVLSACSTVGEFAEEANELLAVPVYRIDEAMAEKAVGEGTVISVFATLNSTLEPTVRLVRRKAREAGKDVTIHTVLVDDAYEALIQGNREAHDAKIKEAVKEYLDRSDRILLAQASMASAIADMKEGAGKVLTSPVLGIEKLRDDLSKGE